jgi:hypothetical protein
VRTAEHIVLESDVRELPRLQSPRRVHASLQCRSRLRRQRLTLSIIDYYYLAVHVGRSETAATEYVLDLRFIDPSFAFTRRIPWRCVWAALALTTAATAASAVWYATDSALRERHLLAQVSAALIAATALTYLAVAVRLLETVALYTLHGRAAVLEYRGGAGTLRRFRPFMRKLAAHVQLAATARRTTRAEHLRDELREHYRLKEDGVLPVETYDASKARILAQHRVTGAPAMSGARAFV